MAYFDDGIKVRMFHDTTALEWRWSVEARGTAVGEMVADCGSAATHTDALTAIGTAITNRLA